MSAVPTSAKHSRRRVGGQPPDGAPESAFAVMSTVDLVARVRGGDQAAGRVPRRIRGMLDTQDLVAEALERGVARLLDVDLPRQGALMAYFRQILRNLIVDKVRAAERVPVPASLDDRHADDTRSPLELALDREKLDRYDAALQRLKPRDAELIILRVEQQADYEEIVVFLGLPSANAARVAVRRALLRLAHEMSGTSRVRGATKDGESS
jgi:RNA polymerase sigma-70 factor, ECF subfamily